MCGDEGEGEGEGEGVTRSPEGGRGPRGGGHSGRRGGLRQGASGAGGVVAAAAGGVGVVVCVVVGVVGDPWPLESGRGGRGGGGGEGGRGGLRRVDGRCGVEGVALVGRLRTTQAWRGGWREGGRSKRVEREG